MKHSLLPAQLSEASGPKNEADTRLPGLWLVWIRFLCIALCLLSAGFYTAGVLSFITHDYTFCTGPAAACLTYGNLVVPPSQGLGLSREAVGIITVLRDTIFSLVYWLVAALLFWRKPEDRMALLAAFSLGTFPLAFNFGFISTLPSPWWLVATVISFLGSLCFTLFYYTFPSGHFAPRWIPGVYGLVIIYRVLNTFFRSDPFNPLSRSILFSDLIFFGLVSSYALVQFYRYRRVSNPIQRQQTKWVVYGICMGWGVYLLVLVLSLFFPILTQTGPLVSVISGIAVNGFLTLIPLAIGFAVARSRLWDIDIVINRTLVYGCLSVCVVVVYVLVVEFLGALIGIRGNLLIDLIATGLVAILLQPLRERVQRGVNHLLYGQRDEPYAVITHLSQRLEGSLSQESVLTTVVETVAQALKLPYAAILLKQEDAFQISASVGEMVGEPLILPLIYQKETIGQLQLAPRTPGEAFTPADRRLLDELARQAGQAAHAVQLTADLRRSHEQLEQRVEERTREIYEQAQELAALEERQKLARELHDSVSQILYGISLGVHTARTLLDRDPTLVSEQLDDVLALTKAGLAEMRALIFELRPESLETEGLVSALTKQAAALQARYEVPVETSLCDEPDLPLKTKQELYRVAQEALHNTIKHARARQVNLRLDHMDGAIILEIRDNGVGFDPRGSFPGHIGLLSMRERLEKLGGVLSIESTPGQGTTVQACLPDGTIVKV